MIQFQKQLITPTMAQEYLSKNTSNRRVKQPLVIQYANDMFAGRWKEDTGEAIKITIDGRILDGQHRLLAIVKSKVPVWMHVVLNVKEEVFDVLDTGSSRNATDVFLVKGIRYDNIIPSIISVHNLLVNNKRYGAQKNYKSTNAMLLDQYFSDEVFWQNVAHKSRSWYLSFAKILTPSFIGGFYSYFLLLNEKKAECFMVELTTGIRVTNEVVMLLRNTLMKDKISPKKMPPTLKMALIIKAWNAYVTNQSVKLLKFDTLREEFPTAKS